MYTRLDALMIWFKAAPIHILYHQWIKLMCVIGHLVVMNRILSIIPVTLAPLTVVISRVANFWGVYGFPASGNHTKLTKSHFMDPT